MIKHAKMAVTLILLLFVLTICVGKTKKGKKTTKGITPTEAMQLIEENKDNPNFVILDIRTPGEFADGHIENAVMIDYYDKKFKQEIAKLDRSKTYLVYCRSGNRSGKSMSIFQQKGFTSVYDMKGGINSWRSKGLPLVQ